MNRQEEIKALNKLLPKEKIIKWLNEIPIKERMVFQIDYLTIDTDNYCYISIENKKEDIQNLIKFINNEEIGIRTITRII